MKPVVWFVFVSIISVMVITIAMMIQSADHTVAVGAWTHGLWNQKLKLVHTDKLAAFEQRVDKRMALAHIYVGWHDLDTDQFEVAVSDLTAKGWMPLISSNPYFHETCVSKGETIYKSISKGDCDVFIHKVAQRLGKIDSRLMLRFAWEMNIAANEWSIQHTNSKSTDFIAAWRHVHAIFAEENVNNVVWVFAPNVRTSESSAYSEYYPGGDVVDWIGLDGYNWGTTKEWSSWQGFYDIFYASYAELTMLAPDKPLMISEFGTTDQGGNKAAWYSDMLEDQIPGYFPNVRAIVFYDEDRSVSEGVDWRIDSDIHSVTAVKKALNNHIYTSTLIKE